MSVEILLIITMLIFSFILYELATMSPLGWHPPPHLVDSTDTLYLGDQHWQETVLVFLDFYFFAFINLPMCHSVCVSVGLFAIHSKFLKTHCYDVPSYELKIDKNAVIIIGSLRLPSWQWPKISIGPAK